MKKIFNRLNLLPLVGWVRVGVAPLFDSFDLLTNHLTPERPSPQGGGGRINIFNWKFAISLLFAMILFGQNAFADDAKSRDVLQNWYKLILELVRHTATYSPPVASRSFAYLGVTAYESIASGSPQMQSLAGQVQGLKDVPKRQAGKTYDDAIILQSAMTYAAHHYFGNTGPTGQRAMLAMEKQLRGQANTGVAKDVVKRSENFGIAVAAHIFDWSKTDGGADIENLGFPDKYTLTSGPAHWVPTSPIRLQQFPLLPNWGKNRTFAIPAGTTCALPPPPDYSEDKNSEFYKQAMEVYTVSKNLTPEQKATARFWSDDPMLSLTPPGHWVSIIWQVADREKLSTDRIVETLARVGVAEADAFIGCWSIKYQYDLLRPFTYIRKVIDPKWTALLITPPFPEYPSGHSTNSAAAALVLGSMYGENYAFEDATPQSDGLLPRKFSSFMDAAKEAANSRLYGGIHFRAAIERGLDQGRCIGAFAAALKMSH